MKYLFAGHRGTQVIDSVRNNQMTSRVNLDTANNTQEGLPAGLCRFQVEVRGFIQDNFKVGSFR